MRIIPTVRVERWSRDVAVVAQAIRVTWHNYVPAVGLAVPSLDDLFDMVA